MYITISREHYIFKGNIRKKVLDIQYILLDILYICLYSDRLKLSVCWLLSLKTSITSFVAVVTLSWKQNFQKNSSTLFVLVITYLIMLISYGNCMYSERTDKMWLHCVMHNNAVYIFMCQSSFFCLNM